MDQGLGKHYEFISAAQRTQYFKHNFFIALIPNTTGLALMKVSIGLSLLKLIHVRSYSLVVYVFLGMSLRIHAPWNLEARLPHHSFSQNSPNKSLPANLSGITAVSWILAWGTIIFFCDPVRGFWDKSIKPKCYDIRMFVAFGIAHTGRLIWRTLESLSWGDSGMK